MLHGTKGNSPFRLARGSDGFDLDGRADCLYSRAVYFAARSCYSHAYAHRTADVDAERPDASGPFHHLIVALVLRGAMKREPAPWPEAERAQPGAARRRLGDEYDSVEGGPHRPRHVGPGADDSLMCAVYKSSQAMAEYVVTYAVRARKARVRRLPHARYGRAVPTQGAMQGDAAAPRRMHPCMCAPPAGRLLSSA